MPSPKNGTITADVATAVAEFAAGKVEFRNDAGGNIHVVVGKQSFESEKLVDNIETFVSHIKKIKPASAKGTYIKKMCVSATMSPSVAVSI
jgi:large subunit ribosomal protein L1